MVDGQLSRRTPTAAAMSVVLAVGLAFADASIVALALVDLYAEFDTSIVGVSWVLTSYALAVVVAALPLGLLRRSASPTALTAIGATVFGAASVVAAAANGLTMLLAARCVQGAGATALLAGSLPWLRRSIGPPARRWWAVAGAVGTAVGPALGGVLTQLFNWRAIFVVQAPIAFVAAVAALRRRTVRIVHEDPNDAAVDEAGGGDDRRPRVVALANIGFGLLFAALVAALFLGVLLVIEVWRYEPLHGALLVSALPVGIVAGRTASAAPPRWRAVGGSAMLALGLVALAVMPGERAILAMLALVSCGAGFGLVHDVLDDTAVRSAGGDGHVTRGAARSVGARHAGLVVGLLLIAPVLSSSITAGVDRATFAATATMLDSPLPLSDKLPITWELHAAIDDARRGQVPDLGREFDERGAKRDEQLAAVRDDLVDTVADAMTRAFRPAFVIAAVLAAAAMVPALLVAGRSQSRSHGRRPAEALVVLAALGLGTVVTSVALGGLDSGEHVAIDPCTAGPDPRPGGGLDAAIQRIVLTAVNGAACELGTTREVLVLSLDSSSEDDIDWDRATVDRALREAARRAIDDAVERGDVPAGAVALLRFAVERLPLDELIERLPSLG